MSPENDKLLCEKYPKLFVQRDGDMTTTAMCWGFECGDGWFNIIEGLCSNIQWAIDQSIAAHNIEIRQNIMVAELKAGNSEKFDAYFAGYDPIFIGKRKAEMLAQPERTVTPIIEQVEVTQVKEKFGTLRFYYTGGNEYIAGMVRMAESMSDVMCEECGAPGVLRGGGWLRTLCDTHAEKHGYNLTPEEESEL